MLMDQLGCHAGRQEVSRCRTRCESEESVTCRQQGTVEYNLALKPGADHHQKSKTGVSVVPEKD